MLPEGKVSPCEEPEEGEFVRDGCPGTGTEERGADISRHEETMREMATESPPSEVADPGKAQDVVTLVQRLEQMPPEMSLLCEFPWDRLARRVPRRGSGDILQQVS